MREPWYTVRHGTLADPLLDARSCAGSPGCCSPNDGADVTAALPRRWHTCGGTGVVIRLVVTDLDGTLWGPDMVVPPPHREAIAELGRRGVTVLAATSRRPRVVRPRFQAASLALPAVLIDGAVGIDFRTEERFHQAAFSGDDAAAVLNAFRSRGLDPCVFVDDPDFDVLVSHRPSTSRAHLEYLGELARVGDLEEAVAARSIYAFSLAGLPLDRLEPVGQLLMSSLGTEVLLCPEPKYGGHGLIVNAPAVSKSNGITAYCQAFGIATDEVLAVGDGDNDVTMLTGAAVALAVEGGAERALATAQHVIGPPEKFGWTEVVGLC